MISARKAPKGKFRVLGVDLFAREHYVVEDFDDREIAFQTADSHNQERSGSMSDVYYVYNDRGSYLRGEEAVGGKISP